MKKNIHFPKDPHFKKYSIPERDVDLSQRNIDLLDNLGIHVDYIDDLAQGKPFGAKIIYLPHPTEKDVSR